jgi:AcrR family transcriptional regulator
MRRPAPRPPTRERLLAAASDLFAERGFHRTTARDIAARAGVNLASGHYHYGSKKDLYLAVLRAQFADVRSRLVARGASLDSAALDRLSRRELEALLEARIATMLEILIGPPPGRHGTLMQREMTDPSEALPVIVEEFILPMKREMEEIVSRCVPGLERRQVERCGLSIVGQATFYRFATPAMLRILGRSAYPADFARTAARHIASFSLGGMERLAAASRRGAAATERRFRRARRRSEKGVRA